MVVPGCDADRGAVQLLGALHAELLAHHEALAVIVIDGGEIEAERGVARQRDGRVARQDIDLARLQRGEALLGGRRHVFDLLRVAEEGGRHGPADVDVETDPLALAVGLGEARDAGVDAADQLSARLDRVEILAGLCRSGDAQQGDRGDAGGHVFVDHSVCPFVVASAARSTTLSGHSQARGRPPRRSTRRAQRRRSRVSSRSFRRGQRRSRLRDVKGLVLHGSTPCCAGRGAT